MCFLGQSIYIWVGNTQREWRMVYFQMCEATFDQSESESEVFWQKETVHLFANSKHMISAKVRIRCQDPHQHRHSPHKLPSRRNFVRTLRKICHQKHDNSPHSQDNPSKPGLIFPPGSSFWFCRKVHMKFTRRMNHLCILVRQTSSSSYIFACISKNRPRRISVTLLDIAYAASYQAKILHVLRSQHPRAILDNVSGACEATSLFKSTWFDRSDVKGLRYQSFAT